MEEAEDIIDEIVMLPTGCVEATLAGKLPCKYIIHAVGPNMNDPSQLGIDRNQLLEYAVTNALKMADELECTSISMPAIATGSFGFPKKKCAKLMIDCVVNYVKNENTKLKVVKLLNHDQKTVNDFIDEFDYRFAKVEHEAEKAQ